LQFFVDNCNTEHVVNRKLAGLYYSRHIWYPRDFRCVLEWVYDKLQVKEHTTIFFKEKKWLKFVRRRFIVASMNNESFANGKFVSFE